MKITIYLIFSCKIICSWPNTILFPVTLPNNPVTWPVHPDKWKSVVVKFDSPFQGHPPSWLFYDYFPLQWLCQNLTTLLQPLYHKWITKLDSIDSQNLPQFPYLLTESSLWESHNFQPPAPLSWQCLPPFNKWMVPLMSDIWGSLSQKIHCT